LEGFCPSLRGYLCGHSEWSSLKRGAVKGDPPDGDIGNVNVNVINIDQEVRVFLREAICTSAYSDLVYLICKFTLINIKRTEKRSP
jgi:hypothetical protein